MTEPPSPAPPNVPHPEVATSAVAPPPPPPSCGAGTSPAPARPGTPAPAAEADTAAPEPSTDFRGPPWQIVMACGGPAATNGWLLVDRATSVAAVIDAPYEATAELLDQAASLGARVELLLLTHGHWDHIAEHLAVTAPGNVRVAIHPDDEFMLREGQPAGMRWKLPIPQRAADFHLRPGEPVRVGGLMLDVLHTPGHSAGSVCLLLREPVPERAASTGGTAPTEPGRPSVLFAGDTLFEGAMGRVDFPGGDVRAMAGSLRALMELPDDVIVLPGHGDATSIGIEREGNPYVRQALAGMLDG